MKVLLLFSNSTVRRGKAFPDDLQELLQNAAEKNGEDIEFFVSYARSLSFLISNKRVKIRDHKNHMNLEEYDFVYFRKAGAAMQQMQTCALYLKDRGIPFWDTELLHANSRNKLTQMIMLQRRNLPIAPTLFCRNRKRLLRLVTKKHADVFAFPLILKATGGSRGEANYLIEDEQELLERVANETNRSFMVQAYIPNDGDYRFFIANGKLKGIIGRRAVSGSHLSNTSKGGSAEILPHDEFGEIVRTHAVQAASIFYREVAGVDIMFDKTTGQHYFLEVNRAPQIEHASFENEKADWIVTGIINAVANYQPSAGTSEKKIGRFEYVAFAQKAAKEDRVIAKIDTGADSSSIHAENIREEDGKLKFDIEKMPFAVDTFYVKRVRSSNGELQARYYVTIPIYIGSVKYLLKTTLSNRSTMKNTMLIGRRFLREHNLTVDVSRRFILSNANKKKGVKK
jgi:RimK family alpha-L-glutamate ligase